MENTENKTQNNVNLDNENLQSNEPAIKPTRTKEGDIILEYGGDIVITTREERTKKLNKIRLLSRKLEHEVRVNNELKMQIKELEQQLKETKELVEVKTVENMQLQGKLHAFTKNQKGRKAILTEGMKAFATGQVIQGRKSTEIYREILRTYNLSEKDLSYETVRSYCHDFRKQFKGE